MPQFAYRAYDVDGRMVAGTVSALHEADALRDLHQQGLVPFQAQAARAGERVLGARRRRPRSADAALVLRDLTVLIEASIPLDQALRMAAAQPMPVRRKSTLEALHEAVVRGHSLSDAMAGQDGAFSASQIAVTRAGEVSGRLPDALRSLCATAEREHELKARLQSAFLYPGILVAMALFALGLIFVVMVPAIAPLFEGQDRPKPLILIVAAWLSAGLRSYGVYFVLLAAAAAIGLARLARSERFRARRDDLVLRLPLAGAIARQAETARFARTFGTLLGSGAPLLQAVSISAEATRNSRFREALNDTSEALKRGVRLSDALGSFTALPEASRSLIAVGDETNRLPELLMRVAEANEKELNQKLERMMTILTPAVTIGVGVLVGGIIMSVMNAILSTNDLAF